MRGHAPSARVSAADLDTCGKTASVQPHKREDYVLEMLRKLLAEGAVETTIGIHGVNVMLAKKVRIESADETGIVARIKGTLSGYGSPRMFPWPAVMYIDLEGVVS